MPRVVERLFRPLPDRWLHSAGRWINLVVVPVLLIGAGTSRVYATATTPFEEFLGTLVVVNTALLGVSVLPCWRISGAGRPIPSERPVYQLARFPR